jgi:hypothetical protein
MSMYTYNAFNEFRDYRKTWAKHEALQGPDDERGMGRLDSNAAFGDPATSKGLGRIGGGIRPVKLGYQSFKGPNPSPRIDRKDQALDLDYRSDPFVRKRQVGTLSTRPANAVQAHQSRFVPMTLYDPPFRLKGMSFTHHTKEGKINAWKQLLAAGVVRSPQHVFPNKKGFLDEQAGKEDDAVKKGGPAVGVAAKVEDEDADRAKPEDEDANDEAAEVKAVLKEIGESDQLKILKRAMQSRINKRLITQETAEKEWAKEVDGRLMSMLESGTSAKTIKTWMAKLAAKWTLDAQADDDSGFISAPESEQLKPLVEGREGRALKKVFQVLYRDSADIDADWDNIVVSKVRDLLKKKGAEEAERWIEKEKAKLEGEVIYRDQSDRVAKWGSSAEVSEFFDALTLLAKKEGRQDLGDVGSTILSHIEEMIGKGASESDIKKWINLEITKVKSMASPRRSSSSSSTHVLPSPPATTKTLSPTDVRTIKTSKIKPKIALRKEGP